MDETLNELAEHVAAELPHAGVAWKTAFGELTLTCEPKHIRDVLRFLRDDAACAFNCFTDLCGADYPEREKRFEVVYHLLSPTQNMRVRVKTSVGEEETLPSVIDVFPCANWFEREVYDLYGVLFENHPDLRRILTDYGFSGHPLRKDFPLTGYVEVRYDDEKKRVVYEPVKLTQEFRNFDYLSPWEGTEYLLPGDEKKSQ